jgi:hypothetical protein
LTVPPVPSFGHRKNYSDAKAFAQALHMYTDVLDRSQLLGVISQLAGLLSGFFGLLAAQMTVLLVGVCLSRDDAASTDDTARVLVEHSANTSAFCTVKPVHLFGLSTLSVYQDRCAQMSASL